MSLDLVKVKFTNFRSYRGLHEHVFERGVRYVLARNHDPGFDSNGGGKSSLLATVAWALFGTLATGSDKDEVIHAGTPEVSVELTLGGDFDLHVVRSKARGGPERLEFFDSRRGWVRADLVYVQAQLSETIGLNRSTFFNSFWIDRESRTKQFLFAKPSERQKILEELIGEDFYGPAKIRATQARVAAEKERAAAAAERDGLYEQVTLLRETLRQAEEDLAGEASREAARAEAIQAALNEVESDIEKTRKELEEVGRTLEGLHRSLPIDLTSADLDLTIASAANEIRAVELRLAQELVDPDTLCRTCGQSVSATSHKKQKALRDADTRRLVALRQTLASSRKRSVEIRGIESQIVVFKQKDMRLKGKMSTLVDLKQRTQEKQPTLDSRVPALQERVAELKERARDRFLSFLDRKQRVSEIDESLPVYRLCEEAFGSRGIQNLRLDDVRHLMQQFTDQYLSHLTHGAIRIEYPYANDGFKVLLSMKGTQADIASFSRGESWRACLSVLLALRRVILFLNKSPLNFVVLDDAGSDLDDSGISAIHALAEVLSREMSHVLIAAPHDYDFIPSSAVVRVEKRDGVSRIT